MSGANLHCASPASQPDPEKWLNSPSLLVFTAAVKEGGQLALNGRISCFAIDQTGEAWELLRTAFYFFIHSVSAS